MTQDATPSIFDTADKVLGSSAPAPAGDASSPAGFVKQYEPLARKVGEKIGVAPDVLLGQWGLETGWGRSVIPGTNNLGNIKDPSGAGVKAVDNQTHTTDAYQRFGSLDHFGDEFSGLIGRRYRGAMGAGNDSRSYFSALKRGGYAEDGDYVQKGVSAASTAKRLMSASSTPDAGNYYRGHDQDTAGAKTTSKATWGDIAKEASASAVDSIGFIGQAGGEVGAALANHFTNSEDYESKNLLRPASNAIRDSQTEGGKQAREDSRVQGSMADLLNGDARLPETVDGWMMLGANGLGSMLPMMLPTGFMAARVASLAKSAQAAQAAGNVAEAARLVQAAKTASTMTKVAGAGLEGSMTGGGAAGDVRESAARTVAGMSHDQLMAAVPDYRSTFEATGSEDQARKAVVNSAALFAAGFSAVAGAAGGVMNSKLLMDRLTESGLASIVGRSATSRLARGGVAAAGTGLAEGFQEVSEKVGQNIGENIGLGRDATDNAMRDTAGDFIGGVAAGGPMGFAGGATMSPGHPKPAAPSGPLGRAAAAGGPAPAAPGAPAAPAPVADPFSAKAAEIEAQVRDGKLLDKLREIGEPQTASEFLDALNIAKNPSVDTDVRKQAVDSLDMAMGWIRDGAMPRDPSNGSPYSTSLTVPGATAGGQSDGYSGSTDLKPQSSDLSAGVRQDQSPVAGALPGPRALPAPGQQEDAHQAAADVAEQSAAQAVSEAPAAEPAPAPKARKTVAAPKANIPAGEGTAQVRQRKAQLSAMAHSGFDTIERRADGSQWLVSESRNEEMPLNGVSDVLLARKAIADYVKVKADTAAASPNNDRQAPTEAQIKAGNYKKSDEITINGMRVRLENPAGSTRSGTAPDGKKWSTEMAHHYGEFRATEGADGDAIDVFIGPRPDSSKVFVIDQLNKDGSFDEHKVMMGFTSEEAARKGYLDNYEPGWTGLGAITEMSAQQFKSWAKSPNAAYPASRQEFAKTTGAQDGRADQAGDGLDRGEQENLEGLPGGAQERPQVSPEGDSGVVPGAEYAGSAREGDGAGYVVSPEQWRGVVDALARNGIQAKAANPADPRTKSLNALLDAFASLTGRRGLAVDAGNTVDGAFANGTFVVNIERPQMHVAETIAHEFKHMSERMPGLAKLYDSIWGLISESGRQRYYDEYIAVPGKETQEGFVSGYSKAKSDPFSMAILKEEMVADFMGKRFNDKEWLLQLARRKPNIFGQFVRDWLNLLQGVIKELRGIKGHQIQTKKNVDQYIAQLTKAREIAMDVAEAWAKQNSGLAKSTGAARAMQSAREIDDLGAFNLDIPDEAYDDELSELDMDMLQAELDDLNESPAPAAKVEPNPSIPAETIKAAGPMAESVYPEQKWIPNRGGDGLTTDIVGMRKTGGTKFFAEKDPHNSKLWGVALPKVWVGPSAGEDDGHVTLPAMKKFVARQTAAIDLRARGFDLAHSLPRADVKRLVMSWKGLNESATKYKRGAKPSMTIKDIAADMGITERFDVSVIDGEPLPGEVSRNVVFTNKQTGADFTTIFIETKVDGKRVLQLNTTMMGKGGLGGAAYQLAAEYAVRRNMVIEPESQLSGINSYRRTEQQLSAALRTGKSNIMVPHDVQRVYGFDPNAVTQEQHDDNLARLLIANYRNTKELVPNLDKLRYHPETDSFTNSKGANIEEKIRLLLENVDSRAFGLGRSTLARALMTAAILDGKATMTPAMSFKAPVLYSARDQADLEYAEVEALYKGTPQWLKTPHGQDTKLNERQWVQVRTPSFKAWFGDWEKFAQTSVWHDADRAVSKVVSPDGEPMVVYHGTNSGGFYAFREPGGKKRGDLGIFATNNRGMANSYITRGRAHDIDPPTSKADLEERGYQFENDEYGLTVVDPDGFMVDGPADNGFRFESIDQAVSTLVGDFPGTSDTAAIYEVFLNIRDPLEDDFEGAQWTGDRTGQWMVVDKDGEAVYSEEGKRFFDALEDAEKVAKKGDQIGAAIEHHTSTDSDVIEARRSGLDGAILRSVVDDGGGRGYDLTPSDIFVALSPNQVKSADWNTGEFGDTDDIRFSRREQDPADGDKTDVAKLPPGAQIPDAAAVGSLQGSMAIAKAKHFRTGRELKLEIQQRVHDASKALGVDLTERTQATHQFLADMVSDDAKFALKSNANAVGWYDSKVAQAIGALSVIHPEIESDERSRLAFLWALAVTSNGMKVDQNFKMAEEAYRKYKATGIMPDNIGIGNAAGQINSALEMFNNLVAKMGDAGRLSKFMVTKWTVAEIEGMLGIAPGGEWKGAPVRGAAILGPKIGNGFFSNLSGYFDALTMDRWLMRTWGRMTGTLVQVDEAAVSTARGKLAMAIDGMSDVERKVMASLIGTSVRKKMTKAELSTVAAASQKAAMKLDKRETMMSTGAMNEFRKASNNLAKAQDGQKEAPSGPAERNWIRAVFDSALKKLNADGVALTMSDLQALLWYPERRLYDSAKADDEVLDGYADDEAPDYANAARDLAILAGANRDRVERAMDRAEASGTQRTEPMSQAERDAMLREFRKPPDQSFHMAFELAPDPNDLELTKAWGELPEAVRRDATNQARQELIPELANLMSVELAKTAMTTGGYAGLVNPAVVAEYRRTTVSLEQARSFAAAIGAVLDQDSVALVDGRITDEVGIIRITFDRKIEKMANQVFGVINAAIPGVDAFTARGNNFDILNFTGLPNGELGSKITEVLNSELSELVFTATSGTSHSELITKDTYGRHLQGIRPESGRSVSQGALRLRDRARALVREAVESAGNPPGGGAPTPERGRAAVPRSTDGGAQGARSGKQGAPDSVRLSAREQTSTPEFRAWFGEPKVDSNLVNEDGSPMVLYHGTTKSASRMSQFRRSKYGAMGPAVYLGDSPESSEGYDQGAMMKVYARGKYMGNMKWTEYINQHGWSGAEVAAKADGWSGVYDTKFEDAIAVWDPANIKSATDNDGSFSATNADIRRSARAPGQLFYSELSRQVQGATMKQAPAAAWKSFIKALTQKGVKPDEIEWTGVNEWLDLQPGKVTKDELTNYLASNGVQVTETMLGDDDRRTGGSVDAEGFGDIEFADNHRENTKYRQYTLPGGENYREVLLTLPEKAGPEPLVWTADRMRSMREKFIDDMGFAPETVDAAIGYVEEAGSVDDALRMTDARVGSGAYKKGTPLVRDMLRGLVVGAKKKNAADKPAAYKSNHWSEPNILAHIRVNDRTDADGARVLFVEELQSDWGQQGKKKGFAGEKRAFDIVDARGSILVPAFDGPREEADQIAAQYPDAVVRPTDSRQAVPAAPFVAKTDAWVALALKRVIGMAVDEGYDKVAFVTGEQSAERYDLSKSIESIGYDPKQGRLQAFDKNRMSVIDEPGVSEGKLEDYVGKEVAQRLLSTEPVMGKHLLDGEDLKVGGEGMKAFYDKIVPTVAKDVLKKLGGGALGTVAIEDSSSFSRIHGVEDGNVVHTFESRGPAVRWEEAGEELGVRRELRNENSIQQPGFDITDAMRDRVASGMPLFSARGGWDAPGESRFDDFVYKAQNKHIDTKRVIESIQAANGQISDDLNVYLQEELFHGRTAKRTEDFGKHELEPLMKSLLEDGLTIADVEEYLHARHAEEANRIIAERNPDSPDLQDGGSGMETDVARAYLAGLQPEVHAKLEAAAAQVDAIIAGTRQLYATYDLEDQATVDGWGQMFEHYVPLQREDKGQGMGIGQGFSVKGKETKGRTGSKRKVVDILANIAMQRERVIVRGEKNRVAQALVGLARANPNEDFWRVGAPEAERVYDPKTNSVIERVDPMYKNRPNTMVAKVRGAGGKVEEMAVVFNEEDARALRMAQALKNLDAANLEGLLGISAKITRYFAAVNTQYNPVFGVVNLVRDVQDAMLNLSATALAGHQKSIAKNTLSALRGIYTDMRAERAGGRGTSAWGQLWEQFQEDGGQTGYRDMFANSAERAEALQKVLTPDGWMDSKLGKVFTANGSLKVPMSKARKSAGWLFDWLSDYNEAMENSVRLATYKEGLDAGLTRQQAASLAKNLTVNFNRKGQIGQQAGAVYAFFNAAMQGSARIGQTLFEMEPGQLKTIRLSKTGKRIVYGGLVLGTMQALMLAGAGFSDEDPPEFARDRGVIIPTGGKGYISIPLPLGLGVIPALGRHAAEFALSGFQNPTKRAVKTFALFADAFNPIGGAGLSMQTLAPTALDPLVALSENKDWTGKPIARTSSNKAIPGYTQWKDTASTPGKLIAEAINTLSGGGQYSAGVISPTPDQVDYLIAQVTGGVGRELTKVDQTARSLAHGEELPPYKIPLVGRFYGNAHSQASEGTEFYSTVDKLNALETEAKAMRKDGKGAEADALLRSRPDSYLIAQANAAERQIQRLRREKRELVGQGADRDVVRAKEAQITDAMARLNRAAERLTEKAN